MATSTRSEDTQRPERPATAVQPAGLAMPESGYAVPDLGSFLRQVFPETRTADEAVLGSMTTSPSPVFPPRDYDTALTLLQRAADAFPALLRHCQQLESDLRRQRAESQSDLQNASGEIQQWQQIAIAMKMHIDENEHQLAVMRKRLAVLEERLAAGHSLAQAAEQQASLAIGISTMFHDKIIDAFGVGSAAHAALDSLAQGTLRPGDGKER